MTLRPLLLAVLAALVATACDTDALTLPDDAGQGGDKGKRPVLFSAYASRSLTRSGAAGTLTYAGLTDAATDLGKAGFGVFAYYTNASDYHAGAQPNFMFNQQVKWNADVNLFDYSPVRYWPNEQGSNAQGNDIDKVSFFAYAPYVEVNPVTGYLADPGSGHEGAAWGITATTRNNGTGDPMVKYVASFEPAKSVDLCWGVYNEGSNSQWLTMNGRQTTTDGLPWLNVQHARSEEKRLRFTFRHATAQLNVQIDADVDGGGTASTTGYTTELGTHDGTGEKDGQTKVYVRSISFTGMAAEGALNLNNVKANVPLWMNYSGTGGIAVGQAVTIHDGLRNGYEGTAIATAADEALTGLNPNLIGNPGNTTPGVTNRRVNLFGRTTDVAELSQAICVIPTGERVTMTIVYDVETAVPKLAGSLSDGVTHGTSIENRISTDLYCGSYPLTFEGGKRYTLRLHLGMNSVKLDADVGEAWEEGDDIYP